jgi:methionyl-tRNA formyltransferase
LNIHPSLLPKYRGPSPLPTAMLDDAKKTGVTIMRLDEEMDHGPIVAEEEVMVDEWHTYEDFEEMMARKGALLLARILPDWVAGKIKEVEQDHLDATYTKKIIKEDGLIDLADLVPDAPVEKAYAAFRKIQAFHQWPQAYFFIEREAKKIRVKVTQASFKKDATGKGRLIIEKVVPEGKKEMAYADFTRGYLS